MYEIKWSGFPAKVGYLVCCSLFWSLSVNGHHLVLTTPTYYPTPSLNTLARDKPSTVHCRSNPLLKATIGAEICKYLLKCSLSTGPGCTHEKIYLNPLHQQDHQCYCPHSKKVHFYFILECVGNCHAKNFWTDDYIPNLKIDCNQLKDKIAMETCLILITRQRNLLHIQICMQLQLEAGIIWTLVFLHLTPSCIFPASQSVCLDNAAAILLIIVGIIFNNVLISSWHACLISLCSGQTLKKRDL